MKDAFFPCEEIDLMSVMVNGTKWYLAAENIAFDRIEKSQNNFKNISETYLLLNISKSIGLVFQTVKFKQNLLF